MRGKLHVTAGVSRKVSLKQACASDLSAVHKEAA